MPKTVRQFYESTNLGAVSELPPILLEAAKQELDYIDQMQSGKDLLEIGCGYGRLLHAFAPKMHHVVGIDFSKSLTNQAQQTFANQRNVQVYQMDATQLGIRDNAFDYVVCMGGTFGNMPNIEEQVLQEMIRVVKPHGQVILNVFNENATAAQHANYKRLGLTDITDVGNITTTKEGLYSRRFTQNDLEGLFANAGLTCSIKNSCPIGYLAIASKH